MPDLKTALQKATIGVSLKTAAVANPAAASLTAPTDGNRAGRAPYNFVPPPVTPRLNAKEPPGADRYHDKHRSGEILLKITAETDFYIRGTWKLNEFVHPPDGREVDIKDQKQPFFQGKRLPGSSLRGMIRSLVEILGDAPLDPVTRQRFAFRTLGASANSTSPTFEPCHQTWTARTRDARGGYLVPGVGDRGWKIIPAKMIAGATFCKFPDSAPAEPPAEVCFPTPVVPTDGYDRTPRAACCWTTDDPMSRGLPHRGWRIRSGNIEGKCHQWIVYERADPNQAIPISPHSVQIHREAGLTKWVEEWRTSYQNGIPCFFSDVQGEVWFGPTRNFKVPCVVTTEEANPVPRSAPPSGWDLAQAIFGRLKQRNADGARSRVFFEDAFLTSGDVSRTDTVETVFGEPKPTTFQHYLQQSSWDQKDSIPWSRDGQPSEKARLRGLKMYWHRKKQIPMPDKSGGLQDRREKQNTVFERVVVDPNQKPAFIAKVRFENLTDVELGALLCALALPSGLRHQLGLAKPFGLGVIRVDIDHVSVIEPEARYIAFLEGVPASVGAETPAVLADGLVDKTVVEFQKVFANVWHKKDSVESMWEIPRFRELKALLAWDDLPNDADIWNNMTRYLAFGQLADVPRPFDYNEYLRVGHGERVFPPRDQRGKASPRQERRRPLPLASQVLEDARKPTGPILPNDPRPEYIDPASAAVGGAPGGGSHPSRLQGGGQGNRNRDRDRRR